MTLAEAREYAAKARAEGKRIVLTNGIFDVLHVGHVRYLKEARALGDLLIVGLNSDASTRGLKGEKRPIVPQAEREELLLALGCVDAVVPFEEPTATGLVTALKPDLYAKGGDYVIGSLPEAEAVHSYGGQVKLLQLVEGRSTTDIVQTIVSRYCQ